MKIVVFGANGPTGRLLTEQALAEGHDVAAVTRRPTEFPLHTAGVTVVGADVHDQDAVDDAIAGCDAVLSTLGVPYSRKPITVYSEGVRHIAAAMSRRGVKRLVVVSSTAVEPGRDPQAGLVFRRVIEPFLTEVVGKTAYDDMRRMEAQLPDTDVDWTIVRPSGLFEHPTVTDYRVGERYVEGRFTARSDLAASMLSQLEDDRFVRRTMAVTTNDVQPNLLRLIWREAFTK